jgi:hypothetical protein
VARVGDLCGKCERETAEARGTSPSRGWMDEVIEAIETAFAGKRSETRPPFDKASLWDLFDLDPSSESGIVLDCLDAKTLYKLRDWLVANEEEALRRDEQRGTRYRFAGLRAHVGVLARLHSLPNDREFYVVGYKRSGRVVDITIPIRLVLLRREPRYWSERDLAEQLGIPRSTLWHISKRM